jgi:hypothetical protein
MGHYMLLFITLPLLNLFKVFHHFRNWNTQTKKLLGEDFSISTNFLGPSELCYSDRTKSIERLVNKYQGE